MRILAFLGVLHLAAALPPKTMSAVCPAISFDQRLEPVNGGALFTFMPHGTHHFEFINVIISLESLEGVVLKEKSYPLQLGQNGMYQKQLLDDIGITEVLQRKRPNIVLRYSFTYCVMLPTGGNADCNTEPFTFEQAQWRTGEFPPCPTQCGMTPSVVTREVVCALIGSQQGTDVGKCTTPAPEHTKQCPATQACITFGYTVGAMQACSEECGLPEHTIDSVTGCRGSDGNAAPIEACKDQPKPQPRVCPATAPCVWVQVGQVQCPKACGQQAVTYEPGQLGFEIKCVGASGDLYPPYKCATAQKLPSVHCPATAPCEKLFLQSRMQTCPTECGLPSSILPPDISCISSIGGVDTKTDGARCNHLDQPSPLVCPATTPCLLPKYCPAIDYVEDIQRTGNTLHISFKPLMQNVEKYHFEFIDVHIMLENQGGSQIMPAQNYRMTPTEFTWHFTLPNDVASKLMTLQGAGRMVYWFTYCVGSFPNNIDCDTERKFFYL